MKIKRKLMFGIFLVAVSLFSVFVYAVDSYSSSSPQFTAPGASSFSYLQRQGVNAFPTFNPDQCKAGQDFILQIDPLGCEPTIVRSDLLEEQNVPVFCPIVATKINPLIDVNAIDSITFGGNYSRDVAGVGFHPAQAAIRSTGGTIVNSPVLGNIGYAVIVLRQNPNESSMPDFVEGNLTANIRYDIENAYGVGRSVFYLPVLDNSEWGGRYTQYGFWNGNGFLRADSVGQNGARISLYLDKDNVLSSFNLNKGETSNQIYLPGFYCQTGLQLRLDGLENPDTRARLNVNGEIFELGRKDMFLDNRCQVLNIKKRGLDQRVDISCREDTGSNSFSLAISPQVTLHVGDEVKTAKVGDFLYESSEGEAKKFVYLGYVGSKDDSEKNEDMYVYLVATTTKEDRLTDKELNYFADLVRKLEFKGYTGAGIIDAPANFINQIVGNLQRAYGLVVSGEDYRGLDFSSPKGNVISDFKGMPVVLDSFALPKDVEITDSSLKQNYENAKSDYESIINNYGSEVETLTPETTFGEKSLINIILLTDQIGLKETKETLCNSFDEKFPKSSLKPEICSKRFFDQKTVSVNGKAETISFTGIYEPGFQDFGAEIEIKYPDGRIDVATLSKNEFYYMNDIDNEYIQLVSLTPDSAELNIRTIGTDIATEAAKRVLEANRKLLPIDSPTGYGKYTITIKKINLNQVAKVSVLPNIKNAGTEANIGFKIGIEKRAIQLSPDKINEKLKNLNESIDKWTGVSNNLGDVVKGFNGACLATGGYLTVKNLVQNRDGKALARQEVMRSDGGWFDICTKAVNNGEFSSVDSCLTENNDKIEADVSVVENTINNQQAITEENVGDRIGSIKDNLKLDCTEKADLCEALSADGYKQGKFTLTEARDIERLNSILSNSGTSSDLRKIAQVNLDNVLNKVNENSKSFATFNSIQQDLSETNTNLKITSYNKENTIKGIYSGGSITSADLTGLGSPLETDPSQKLPAEVVSLQGTQYLVVLQKLKGNEYSVLNAYEYKGVQNGHILVGADKSNNVREAFGTFTGYDQNSYNNQILDPEVKYYETDPYKGYPAIVPIDVNNGWYAAMKQTLPGFGNVRAYDESGKVASFYLCNVGQNGKPDFNTPGFKDDTCKGINQGIGDIYGEFQGISDPSKVRQLVDKANQAISEAQRKYKPGLRGEITILGQVVKVGTPATSVSELQCQDFMSPNDCLLLFNVCDPVVCPSSRCNLGGNYYVSDVVQSGIVGSTLLCLPNIKEKIAVPICLTGVKAGIDGLVSVEKNYRDCLQQNLETGETVGICDEIHSIYLCDFFWSQAAPLSKIAIPKIFEFITGQGGTRGGGEYAGAQSAWDNAQKSVDYFSNYYASNSFEAFKARALGNIGTSICQNFISASYPQQVDILSPESPPQYHAWFKETTFTTATVPPTSQYKVFYNIYAGENIGAYYSVYLKAPVGTSYYQTNPTVTVQNGFIPKGESVSETKDFTAPSGYKQLCIRVNEQEECGFQEVTTSFALDYLQSQYINEQAGTTNINSESECVSGTPSVYSFANPNIQAGATEAVNPGIYNQGLVRVCSTDNPGKSTNPERWKEVGTCDNGKGYLKCYLDQNSVSNSLQSLNIGANISFENDRNKAINELINQGQFLSNEKFSEEVNKIYELDDNQAKINYIEDNDLINRIIFNAQKARILLIRGDAYSNIAVSLYEENKRKQAEDVRIASSSDCGQGYTLVEAYGVCYPEATSQDDCSQGYVFSSDYKACLPEGAEPSATDTSSSKISQVLLDRYNSYAPFFEQYASANLPTGWNKNDFKALVVAIAQKETSLGGAGIACGPNRDLDCTDWLTGYNAGGKYPDDYKGAVKQIELTSKVLESAFDKNNNIYQDCYTKTTVDEEVKCVLSIYNTGKDYGLPSQAADYLTLCDNNGFTNLNIVNCNGIAYSNQVFQFWQNWKGKLVDLESGQTSLVSSSSEKWTLFSAIQEVKKRSGSYSDNKLFIDGLYKDGILTQSEYSEINGAGPFNFEENMAYVLSVLETKLIVFKFNDGNLKSTIVSYRYEPGEGWKWHSGLVDWKDVSIKTGTDYSSLSLENMNVLNALISQSYEAGFIDLVNSVVKSDNLVLKPFLYTDINGIRIDLLSDGLFRFESGDKLVYNVWVKNSGTNWYFTTRSPTINSNLVNVADNQNSEYSLVNSDVRSILKSLSGKSFEEGSKIIFGV